MRPGVDPIKILKILKIRRGIGDPRNATKSTLRTGVGGMAFHFRQAICGYMI